MMVYQVLGICIGSSLTFGVWQSSLTAGLWMFWIVLGAFYLVKEITNAMN